MDLWNHSHWLRQGGTFCINRVSTSIHVNSCHKFFWLLIVSRTMALTYKVIHFPLLKFRIIDVRSWWLKHNCCMTILCWIIATQNAKSSSCIARIVTVFIHHKHILIEKIFRKRSVSYNGIFYQVWTDDWQFVKCHDLSCFVTKVLKPKIEM